MCVGFSENSVRDGDLHGGVESALGGSIGGVGGRKQIGTLMSNAATTEASAHLGSGLAWPSSVGPMVISCQTVILWEVPLGKAEGLSCELPEASTLGSWGEERLGPGQGVRRRCTRQPQLGLRSFWTLPAFFIVPWNVPT